MSPTATTTELFLGIDLGTTNSAAALSDGSKVTLVQSAQGGVLTPSVVRIDGKGNVVVGQRARRFLESDAENTRAEFKRLMGSGRKLGFAAAKAERTPEELAAEVLRVIRNDVLQQTGVSPARAVITVPAMFELPQSAATAEAARLAGFDKVEFLQEPVASAIAAGWTTEEHAKSWLVYDLGGGTFDVSLLETQDGVLRVVGHDGDNFLGGRDMDAAIVEGVIAEIEKAHGATLDRKENAVALRRLRVLAEEAKVDAGRGSDVAIAAPALLRVNGELVDVDVSLPHAAFAELVRGLIDRSLRVCERLLRAHGLAPKDLGRVVLVGGPTMMQLVRDRVAEVLGAPLAPGLDPMTLVAQGAATFAATSGLSLTEAADAASNAARENDVWLQHPLVTPDPSPYVVGKLVSARARASVVAVRFSRADGSWTGAPEPVDEEGTFAASVSLVLRAANELVIEGLDKAGGVVSLTPRNVRIRHGVTLSDPPLSRTIGIGLADDGVRTFFERGSPLPMRRTFVLHTTHAITAGDAKSALRVPIVQGEFASAHLCRVVGALELTGDRLTKGLPAGSAIELTLAVDRGGGLAATALVPAAGQVFERVAQLVAPALPPDAQVRVATELRRRVESLYSDGDLRGDPGIARRLGELDQRLERVLQLAARGEAGDDDATEQASRQISDIDGELSTIEAEKAWPELDREFAEQRAWAAAELLENGTDAERHTLEETLKSFERARTAKNEREAQRQLTLLRRLGSAAYFRRPDSWSDQFDYWASRISEASDLAAAQKLVARGRAAQPTNDRRTLEEVVGALRKLIPSEDASHGLGSGVR